jgi:hypothetical protein
MPYKDPERKRQWERQHRDQRIAQRRQRRLEVSNIPVVHGTVADPCPAKDSGDGWKILATLAAGVGIALLGAFAAVNRPNSSRGQ